MSMDLLESDASEMTEDGLDELLTEQGVCVLGIADGSVPYLLPMSFGYDGADALYFLFLLFGESSRKEQLCDEAERASVLVYRARSMHDWESARLVGRTRRVDDSEWGALREAMANAWHPSLFSSATPTRGVEGYRFDVDEWTGVVHGD